MNVRAASPDDWPAIEALLVDCALPTEGAREHLSAFVVAADNGLAGCAGAEIYGDSALLRSVAVRGDARGKGLGGVLIDVVFAQLEGRGVTNVSLLTTTAEFYFAARGFVAVPREQLPAMLNASAEFKGARPATAVAMFKRL